MTLRDLMAKALARSGHGDSEQRFLPSIETERGRFLVSGVGASGRL